MARSKDNLADDFFDLLLAAPWWGGPLLALAAYLLLRFAAPLIFGTGLGDARNPGEVAGHVLSGFLITAAPWAALLILLCWLLTRVRKFFDRRLLDTQEGLDSIRDLSWQEFERLVAEAYRRQGCVVEHTGSAAGDDGIDLALRRGGKKLLVQCKHWKAWKVGVKEVRELLGVVASERAHGGILVTYGSFTDEAVAFARKNPITLVAGAELEQMIRSVQAVPPRKNLDDHNTHASPACPTCGTTMVRRMARRGRFAGQPFWSCPRLPPAATGRLEAKPSGGDPRVPGGRASRQGRS